MKLHSTIFYNPRIISSRALTALFILIAGSSSLPSCKKFVETTPTDKTTKAITFSSVQNAGNAVNGMYSDFATAQNIYRRGLYTDISLMADELKTTNIGSVPFSQNSVTPQIAGLPSFWGGHYAIINHANLVIDNLPSVPGLQPGQKAAWTGEAKFIRAWSYMVLTQLFGKVPKVVSSDWRANVSLPRSSVDDIMALIGQDLQDAEASLPHDYGDAQKDRIRVTKGAATALLVKYDMLKKDWAGALAKATALINDSAMYHLEPIYANVFQDNSVESIWELAFDVTNISLLNASFGAGRGTQYVPSTQMAAAFNASAGDQRANLSVGGGKVGKYPSGTTRNKMLRMADIFLLRAEAEAQLNNLAEGLADLNRIRARAGVTLSTASNQAGLLSGIANERFLELAFEGHRWFDLVRTGMANTVLAPLKGASWQITDILLPVPQTEINLNAHLLPQNAPF